jgi:hypothetical protein
MRIFDIIIDKLNETTLFEMAFERKKAKKTVTSLSPQIVKHLIKLFVFNSPENKTKWISEIDGWLNDIDDIYLKPDTEKLEYVDVHDWMINQSSPHYNGKYLDSVVRKLKSTTFKNVTTYDYDSNHIMEKILTILNNVCKSIGNDTFTTIEDYLPIERTY